MSDLLYYITAVTKGKKPKVVFLKDEMWVYNVRCGVDALELPEAKRLAKNEPTHCLFVEAHDGVYSALERISDKKNRIDVEEFYKIVEELGCKTVSTRRKKKFKIEIAQQEEKREYVLYQGHFGDVIYYYNPNNRYSTILNISGVGKIASLYTENEAEEKVKEIEKLSFADCWDVGRAELFCAEPKKQTGYVLFDHTKNGVKIYKTQTILTTTVNNWSADVYRTKEEADFIAYVLNNDGRSEKPYIWQVEQIQF
jgi:hypothetical protein